MTYYKHSRRGFTLLELSIVLVVVSLLIAGILVVLTQQVRAAKRKELQVKLDAIETALLNYRRANDDLPCPANGQSAITASTFGVEDSSAGVCTHDDVGTFFDSTGGYTYGGVVPVRTLGLPDDAMFDPWGGRFTYAVDGRMTASGAFTTYDPTSTTIGSITVKDAAGNTVTSKAIVVVLSHGGNGHGAFQLSGARKNWGSNNADELKNCHCDNTATATTFNSTFALHTGSGNAGDVFQTFDDVGRYYLRSNMLSAFEASR